MRHEEVEVKMGIYCLAFWYSGKAPRYTECKQKRVISQVFLSFLPPTPAFRDRIWGTKLSQRSNPI